MRLDSIIFFFAIITSTFGASKKNTEKRNKKIPKYAEVITQLDPIKLNKEPLSINNDFHLLAENLNVGFLKAFASFKESLLPERPIVYSIKEMRVQQDEYVPRQSDLVIQSRLPDCRALYMSFKVERILKEGNNRIYLVKEEITYKLYVYKVYNSPDEYSRELLIFQLADHANIMKAVCFHQENISKRPGIVIEYVKGQNAIKWASKQPYHKLKQVAAQMLVALDYLHRLGFIHSDFKADNVIVEEGTERVVLFDFGYTVSIEEGRRGLGTRQYEAPELFGLVPGPIRSGIDMWALGMTILAMAHAQIYGKEYRKKPLFPMIRDRETNTYLTSEISGELNMDVRDLANLLLALDPLEREFVTYRQLQIISKRPFFSGVDWMRYEAHFWNSLLEF